MMNKPYAESCAENRAPIFAVLEPRLRNCTSLLEIGSGTGQHAVYFAEELPQLVWQTSDMAVNHAGIMAWLDEAALPNVHDPLRLDVVVDDWPSGPFDAVFSANTFHIMSWPQVRRCIRNCARVLEPGGLLAVYGPFNFGGRYSSESNASFDHCLAEQHPERAIRDFEAVDELASLAGFTLRQDHTMPANNRLLSWQR